MYRADREWDKGKGRIPHGGKALLSLLEAIYPTGEYTTVCDACPVRRQTYGYFPATVPWPVFISHPAWPGWLVTYQDGQRNRRGNMRQPASRPVTAH